MTELTLDTLFIMMELSPFFDSVEMGLRDKQETKAADELCKLQQDIGVKVAAIMNPDYADDCLTGPEAAALDGQFQDVDALRVYQVLKASMALVSEDLQSSLKTVIENLNLDISDQSDPTSPPSRKSHPKP